MTSLASRARTPPWWSEGSPTPAAVLPVALALIAAQLAFRAWASFGSYWEGDDFVYISRAFAPDGMSPRQLLESYAGHLLPGDFYVTWLVNRISPYDWALAAAVLTGMQLVASLGFLRLMLVSFGRRWGIIPPLVLFLVVSFTVQDSVWWATGIQALPFKISLVWALASQVRYAQTRRATSALAACAWVMFGLLFYEKALLTIGAMAVITVAYFTVGTARERLHQTWHRFRLSVLANAVLGVSYLAVYVHYGQNFGPSRAAGVPIGPTADVMVLRSWGTGVLGGPLHWAHAPGDPVSYARPSSVVTLIAWAALILFVREVARSRTHSMRALILPGYFLVCDVLLVVAGRAETYGPLVGYELRYLTELSVATAAALAFATMPVIGGAELVERRRPSALLDRWRPAVTACLALTILATVSSVGYIQNWHHNQPAKAVMSSLVTQARDLPADTRVADGPVPRSVLLPIAFPDNTLSHLLRPVDPSVQYVTAATDDLLSIGPDGRLGQLDVTPVRAAVPSPHHRCAYRVGHGVRTIRLDGPLLFGPYWVKLGYIATADSAITVSAGGLTQRASVSSGLHTLLFKSGDRRFSSIRLGGLIGEASLCTNDVRVGQPTVAVTP